MKVQPDPLGQLIIYNHTDYHKLKVHSAFEHKEIQTTGKEVM
jgi:hypothetical protein